MALQTFRIPLENVPQKFEIDLAGVTYLFVCRWNDMLEGGWFLDIYDVSEVPLVMGVPLVTGINLLEGFEYVGIPGLLGVVTDGNEFALPTLENLGREANLYYEVDV